MSFLNQSSGDWLAERTTERAPPMPGLRSREELASRLMRMAAEVRYGFIDETRMAALAGCLDEVELP